MRIGRTCVRADGMTVVADPRGGVELRLEFGSISLDGLRLEDIRRDGDKLVIAFGGGKLQARVCKRAQ